MELMPASSVKADSATVMGNAGDIEPLLPEPCLSCWSEDPIEAAADFLLLGRASSRAFVDATGSQGVSVPVLAELVASSISFCNAPIGATASGDATVTSGLGGGHS